MDTATLSTPARDTWRPLRYFWRVPLLLLHALLGIFLCAFILSWNQQAVMKDGRSHTA